MAAFELWKSEIPLSVNKPAKQVKSAPAGQPTEPMSCMMPENEIIMKIKMFPIESKTPLECMIFSFVTYEKQEFIERARERMVVIKIQVCVLHYMKQISVKQFAMLADKMESVIHQTGQGTARSHRRHHGRRAGRMPREVLHRQQQRCRFSCHGRTSAHYLRKEHSAYRHGCFDRCHTYLHRYARHDPAHGG